MPYTKDTESSRLRNQQKPQPGAKRGRGKEQQRAATGRPTPPSSASAITAASGSSSTVAPSESASAAPPQSYKMRITGKGFRDILSRRHGIVWDEGLDWRSPYRHFDVSDAPAAASQEQVTAWYQNHYGRSDSAVWLSLREDEAEQVAEEYRNMKAAEEEEAKFFFYAKLVFFRQDAARHPSRRDKTRFAYCKMEWAPKPSEKNKLLLCPPVLDDSIAPDKPFLFDNKPDLTFWVPLLAVNAEYRANVAALTFVAKGPQVSAPYLTVEFKKDDEDTETATNQLVAAATLILYNRTRLRHAHLRTYNKAAQLSRQRELPELRHYGVAFAAASASLYLFTPIFHPETGEWAGCTAAQLKDLNVDSMLGALRLRSWINEIQNWGLGEHTDSWLLDLKGLARAQRGGREAVSLTTAEADLLTRLEE